LKSSSIERNEAYESFSAACYWEYPIWGCFVNEQDLEIGWIRAQQAFSKFQIAFLERKR